MDQEDSRKPDPNSEPIEAPVMQGKRKADTADSQRHSRQVRRASDKSLRSANVCDSGGVPWSKNYAEYYKPRTSRGAALELLSLAPTSFPTYAAFIRQYYETFCQTPGKIRVDERMATHWLADILPRNFFSQIDLGKPGKPLDEVVAELLQLEVVRQSANRLGVPTVLSQQEQQPAAFQGQPQWQWPYQTMQPQNYWQMPPPYWHSLQQSYHVYPDGPMQQPYGAPKYVDVTGHMPLLPPHPYWY